MERIKSAFEIAMEKANQLDGDLTPEESRMVKREDLKPILADFYKGKIDAEAIWQKLHDEDDNEILQEAQIMLIDSLGLRTTSGEFKRRREAILAVENLKDEQNSSTLEQILEKLKLLQKKYQEQRDNLQEQLEDEVENNSEMQLRPVQTQDGRTVMKMESSIDEDTEKRFKNMMTQLENRSNEMFTQLTEQLKTAVR